ncbi:MAG TPA: FeoA family protein [Phycisphaerales bacterium]|nr:FeoA family protein [Phycisphaerales bacterium]
MADTTTSTTRTVSLSCLRRGQTGVVCEANVPAQDAAYLRAMGLRPNAKVRVCRLGEPCIVEVLSSGSESCGACCRIGLARELADRVIVSGVAE